MFELPIENNKHPNFEWRGQRRGADSVVLQGYPIWVQCLNNFVADCSSASPRQNYVVLVHYHHENIVYQFLTCTYVYCWFARDVMAAMLMVKNKSISICCKLNSIFIVLTNNMTDMSRGSKPRILYAFCFQMLECAYQTPVKTAAHVVRAITLTFVSAQIVLKDIPAQVGNYWKFTCVVSNTAVTTLYVFMHSCLLRMLLMSWRECLPRYLSNCSSVLYVMSFEPNF